MRKHITHYLVFLFAVGALITVSTASFADERHGSGDKNVNPAERYEKAKERKINRMVEELNLTENQQKKIKEIHNGQKNEFLAKKEAVRNAKKAFKKAMQEEITDKELRKLFEASQLAKSEFSKLRFEQILAIRAVLTTEQKKKFKGFKKHRKGRKGKYHEDSKP